MKTTNINHFNCLTVNLDIENLTTDSSIVVESRQTIDNLMIKANHPIEKIIILSLDETFIKGFDVNSPDFVLNISSVGVDMCLIMIIFSGSFVSRNLLLI